MTLSTPSWLQPACMPEDVHCPMSSCRVTCTRRLICALTPNLSRLSRQTLTWPDSEPNKQADSVRRPGAALTGLDSIRQHLPMAGIREKVWPCRFERRLRFGDIRARLNIYS